MPLDHCKECGSSSLDIDTAKGQVVCTVCGEVNESTIVVNDPTYEDNGHGGASIIGTFVSGNSSGGGGLGDGFRGFRHGIARSSKEVTFDKIRREINDRGHQLRMEQHNIDKAFNIYKLAFENRLTKGRRNDLVIAAALYITCRCDGGNAQYLMIDFSEQFSVDIYELGRTYIHFTKALHFTLNSIDPCLYIMRFATRLEFGKQTTEVSNTAMRLVQRMKKDHLHVGRRPSGLCGAALLFAARHHGFNRKPSDIVRVVKVHESTLRKRMLEFGETPSSLLSFEDFMAVDLEEEQDPPAYKEARRRDRERREQEKRAQIQEEEEEPEEVEAQVSELQRQIEELLENRKRKSQAAESDLRKRLASESDVSNQSVENDDTAIQQAIAESTVTSVVAYLAEGSTATAAEPIISTNDVDLSGPTLAMMGLGPPSLAPVTTPVLDEGGGELDRSGLDEDELDYYILNEYEFRVKYDRWMAENEDYVKAQEEKEAQEEKDRLEGKPEKKKRKVQRKKTATTPANTAGEAIEKMLKEKKLSQKINYDVLKQLREGEEAAAAAKAPVVRPTILPSATTSMPPPPPRTSTTNRRIHLKVETGAAQAAAALVKTETQEDRKPVLTKQEPTQMPTLQHDYDEDELDEDEDDYEDEEEEEEQPPSLSSLLSQQQSMYDNY